MSRRYFAIQSKGFVNPLLYASSQWEFKEPNPMQALIARFAKDESGATAIEYGLVAAGISVAIIAVIQGLGNNLKTAFTSLSSTLK
jgi:pilus assembly protein Flp/PilA